jgi:2-hydroxy-6-oxonona-2,4-dienedioate hydrolase
VGHMATHCGDICVELKGGGVGGTREDPAEKEWEQTWVPLASGRVYTRMGGSHLRQPVVLVHGFVLAGDYMMPVAHTFASFCRVYAMDLPGYGRSDRPRRRLELSYLADTVAEWMDALKLRKAHFVGNSFGCQILVEFAVRHADLAERLVLQGPTVDPSARTLLKQILRLMQNSRVESPGLGRLMVRDYWRAGWQGIAATARMALEDRVETKLPRIGTPTLVVRGSRDVLVSQEWAERMVQLLPRGELLVMPGLAHTINYTAPVRFVEAIRPFLGL